MQFPQRPKGRTREKRGHNAGMPRVRVSVQPGERDLLQLIACLRVSFPCPLFSATPKRRGTFPGATAQRRFDCVLRSLPNKVRDHWLHTASALNSPAAGSSYADAQNKCSARDSESLDKRT